MVSSLRQEERSILASCLEALTDTQSEAEEVTDTPSQPEEVQSQQPDVDAVSWRPVDALVFLPVATSEVIGWNWTVWLLMHLSGSAADRGREVAWRPQAHSFHSRSVARTGVWLHSLQGHGQGVARGGVTEPGAPPG